MEKVTGHTLIDWGFKPGPHFSDMIERANSLLSEGLTEPQIVNSIAHMQPEQPKTVPLKSVSEGANGFEAYLGYSDDDEKRNYEASMAAMAEVMRTPVAEKGVLMPDACPTGPGNIPVGGVVSSKFLHPGWHSADICCSVMCSVFGRNDDPKKILDAVQATTHFGGGGRDDSVRFPYIKHRSVEKVLQEFEGNRFLRDLEMIGRQHMATQGDGNHFSFVGRLRSSGQVCLVTHHGSRKPGAMLYKKGLKLAEEQTKRICPEVKKQNAWIVNEEDTREYWNALQIIRQWTKVNHRMVHMLAAEAADARVRYSFWNEHNFVFRRDGLFYHAKGATPTFDHHADSADMRLIPLSMGDPILVVEQDPRRENAAMGFAPHGAGRNISRTEHRNRLTATRQEQFEYETEGLDARFWTGDPDVSELPSAYKDAKRIEREIQVFRLARIVDHIDPYGCLMAGNWQTNR